MSAYPDTCKVILRLLQLRQRGISTAEFVHLHLPDIVNHANLAPAEIAKRCQHSLSQLRHCGRIKYDRSARAWVPIRATP